MPFHDKARIYVNTGITTEKLGQVLARTTVTQKAT